MTVNLDSDLVGTKFDAARQVNIYTARRGDRRWTVEVPLSELQPLMGNKTARRQKVENFINSAMSGPADGE